MAYFSNLLEFNEVGDGDLYLWYGDLFLKLGHSLAKCPISLHLKQVCLLGLLDGETMLRFSRLFDLDLLLLF